MPVPIGGRGRTGTRDRVAAAECQWRIDGQRPVTEWGGTSAVSGRAQVGSAISDGYLHTGGLGFAPGRIGGHDLVRLIPGCAASRGSGRRSLSGLWRGSPTNDLASRPTRTGRTPTHSHSGQFMTRMHPNPISRFHRHPLRLGPAPHGRARGGAGDWSTAGYRHDRINSGDPHISQRSFDSMPGGSPSLPSFSLS